LARIAEAVNRSHGNVASPESVPMNWIGQNGYGMLLSMDKEQIKAALRTHEVELKKSGIVHLHLFGSRVNGTAGPDSDVDLAAVFDRAKVRGILAEVGLKNRLSEILGIEADLANAERLKETVQATFDSEAELVF
jgi:hypothetical protein